MGSTIGISRQKLEPLPSSLSTFTCPRWRRATASTKARPSPIPYLRSTPAPWVRLKRSNKSGRSSLEMPEPWSITQQEIRFSFSVTVTRTWEPASLCLIALDNRFSIARSSKSGSACVHNSSWSNSCLMDTCILFDRAPRSGRLRSKPRC